MMPRLTSALTNPSVIRVRLDRFLNVSLAPTTEINDPVKRLKFLGPQEVEILRL